MSKLSFALSRRLIMLLPVAALGLGLAGCSSMDDISDGIGSLNPFAEKEKILPGQRRTVLDSQTAVTQVSGKTVAIPGAHAQGSWQQSGGTAGNNPGHVALDGGSGARLWSTRAGETAGGSWGGKGVRLFARPVVGDGRIYVYDPNGTVSAHSLDGGGRYWSVRLKPADKDDPSLGGGVAFANGRVYATTAYGTISALDPASGGVLWTKQMPEPLRSAPAVGEGKVYVVSQANTVYAVSEADGNEAWNFRGIPESAGLLSGASPAVSGGFVIVPFTSGELVALSAKDGKQMWNDSISRSGPTMAISGLSDISASPVVDDGIVIATGVGGKMVAYQLKSGQRMWEAPVGSAHTPAVAGGYTFAIDLDDRLVAIEKKSGAIQWVSQLPVTRTKKVRTNWAGPMLAGGSLWLVSSEGAIISVDPASGRVNSSRDTGVSPAFMSPIAVQGRLLVLSGDGTLSAYN
ncbi:MAG: PQQ-binding-like beta-propeller repeat protein [Hyphomicrobiaceae bacterium]|nr:PQQ-binding-like beta-propeller repeat protein [Hyphomicrobiaceae bacterium]